MWCFLCQFYHVQQSKLPVANYYARKFRVDEQTPSFNTPSGIRRTHKSTPVFHLQMSNNPMTSLGASRLLAAIEENVDSCLCMLDIQSVVVYDDVFAILARLKERRSSFRLICSDSFATRRAASTATQCDS